MKYPPFNELILISIISKNETSAKIYSDKFYNILSSNSDNLYSIYSPKAPFAYKINNKYKINILIKCNLNTKVMQKLHENIDKCNSIKAKNISVSVTRNPQTIG